jgi:nitrous-oxide reductase
VSSYLAPEPKSPHGADVTPDGKYIVVAGKLDPHVTIYAFDKIQKAIADKKWELDPFGIPVLDFDAIRHAQVELGLGPLHTQFDDKGYAYTSLFLDRHGRRWTWAGGRRSGEPDWKLVENCPCSITSVTLTAAEGDTVSPDGNYPGGAEQVVGGSLRANVGPLLPQNFQLIDISARHDFRDLRHADGHRRAALRADHQGRQGQGLGSLPRSRLGSGCRRRHQNLRPWPVRSGSSATATTWRSS